MLNKNFDKEYPYCKEQYAISVCRIEPENNIHLILGAFAHQTALPLVLIGNWENSDYGLQLLQKYTQFPNIHLLAPIYIPEKINILRSHASLYIHGHSAGGTNPSLVEAMFFGLPILAFDCIYNRYTTENQCLYWHNSDELLNYIIHNGELKLNDIRLKMKAIADNKYRWDTIVKKYEILFSDS